MTHQHTPPPAPKQGMSTGSKVALFGCGGLVLVGALLFGGCAVVGGAMVNEVDKAVKKDAQEDARAAKEDVKVSKCQVTDDDLLGRDVDAKVKITNNGSKRADYAIEGEFLDQDGNKVGELLASIDNLAPGTSSTQNFGGLFTSDDLKGVTKGSCTILDVSRSEWSAKN